MHSPKAATILCLLTLIACPTLALTQNKSRSQRSKHSSVGRQSSADDFALPAVSLVSGTTEYLSGEANVTVKGNENPIIRLGLATSGVTLVEFPAADRFFAIHPGNSELVTIDESPTKQNDHFFVFRAGSNFIPPPSRPSTAPSTSIIAQMRSGLVITLLVYPVRQLEDMAHTVVVLYDRAEVVASRRAAGLAVNLEENQIQKEQRSIRVAIQSETSASAASTQQEK